MVCHDGLRVLATQHTATLPGAVLPVPQVFTINCNNFKQSMQKALEHCLAAMHVGAQYLGILATQHPWQATAPGAGIVSRDMAEQRVALPACSLALCTRQSCLGL